MNATNIQAAKNNLTDNEILKLFSNDNTRFYINLFKSSSKDTIPSAAVEYIRTH